MSLHVTGIDREPPTDEWGERAARAWSRLHPQRTVQVAGIRKATASRAIFRLFRGDEGGATIIAKRCSVETGWVERTIYESILPRLPVTAPRYHGFVEDQEVGWLFVEDVGDARFDPGDPAQRVLAGQWLGVVQREAARLPLARRLPDRGPNHYRTLLREAHAMIRERRATDGLPAGEPAVLRHVLGSCDALQADWAAIERCCDGVPATLVHGDFRRKNLRIRADESGRPDLYPIDWETAGWGVPAIDLAPSRACHEGRHVDLDAYVAAVREAWPAVNEPAIARLVHAGRVFRRVAGIYWAASTMNCDPRAVGLLEGYTTEMVRLQDATP